MSGQCQATCAGRDQRAYRFAMRRDVFVACADHAAWLTSQGMTLIPVERRVVAAPVSAERRRGRGPAWLRNVLAKDLTGRAA